MTDDKSTTTNLTRRRFLTRASAGVAAVGAAGVPLVAGAPARGATPPSRASETTLNSDQPLSAPVIDPHGTLPAIPFHGTHQAGILTPRPPAAIFVSFDVLIARREELIELMRTLTATTRFLTTGGTPANLGSNAPPADSGTLGPTVPPDALTITVAVGRTLFDDRFEIAARLPRHLVEMTPFPNDDLNPDRTGGDMMLQICAGSPDTTIHALRQVNKAMRGAIQIRWRVDGFVAPPRPNGVPRNHFAFNDGVANPNIADPFVADELLWVTNKTGEPAWAVGGTYQAMRIIQQFTEFWDRVSLAEQQQMIGRFRATGAPLDGVSADDIPDYTSDPAGALIPLNAHIRLANPRTAASADHRIFRRSYNYDGGVDLNGNLDLGLAFTCFQRDLSRQFIATQRSLVGEPMVDYISPVGGGYFFVLPGVGDDRDWYGRDLLTS